MHSQSFAGNQQYQKATERSYARWIWTVFEFCILTRVYGAFIHSHCKNVEPILQSPWPFHLPRVSRIVAYLNRYKDCDISKCFVFA